MSTSKAAGENREGAETRCAHSANQPQAPEPSRDAFVPAFVFHPAEIIREELLARDWTLDTLSAHALPASRSADDAAWTEAWGLERLGWELYMAVAGTANGIRLGEKGAEGLCRAFGISAEFWLATEKLWLAAPVERRSPPTDNEDLLSDEIGANIAACVEKIEREHASAAVPDGGTP